MMKTAVAALLILMAPSLPLQAQQAGRIPIQVVTNEHTTTTFFFPSAIGKTIKPSDNYNFEYRDEEPSIGYLKGKEGSASNLTVITENGYIYSFAISYSEKVGIFNFILTPELAVGRIPANTSGSSERITGQTTHKSQTTYDTEVAQNSKASHRAQTSGSMQTSAPMQTEATMTSPMAYSESIPESYPGPSDAENTTSEDSNFATVPDSYRDHSAAEPIYESGIADVGSGDLYDIDREEYYRIFCENNYLQKTIFKRTFRQNKRVVLKLNNILVDQKEIYFVLQVENNSKKEYSVNGLSFFRRSGVGELQKIMKPLYVFNLQESIDPQSINEVVFIFDRFKLNSKEEVYVVLDEKESNRMIMLPLDNKQINYPTN